MSTSRGLQLPKVATGRRGVLAVLVAVALTGCTTAVERPLPAFGGGFLCRGVGLDATIAGDPDASPPVWLISRSDGQRMEATWPPGSYARFGDTLEIVLESGAVFFTGDDIVDGGCFTSDGGPWAIKYSRYGTLPQP